MKKLFLSVVLLCFMISCTNEENAITQSSTSYRLKNNNLENLYAKLIESESHKAYITSINSYVDKINMYGEFPDFSDEDNMLKWVSLNIDKTGFDSYIDADFKWKEVNAKYQMAVNDNKLFFDHLVKFPGDIVLVPVLGDDPVETNNCLSRCSQSRRGCINAAFDKLSLDFKKPTSERHDRMQINRMAWDNFNASKRVCENTFLNCEINCNK